MARFLRSRIRTELYGISVFEPFACTFTHSGVSAMLLALVARIARQRGKRF
jgi:hypothetical protein